MKFSGKLNPVRDELVVAEVPTSKQIAESIIGSQTSVGLTAGATDNGSGIGNANATGEGSIGGTEIYGTEFLEAMPEFPGGMSAWAKFLTKNLKYPVMATEGGVSGKVLVSFVVEKNGEISNLKVIKGIGGGCDEEAMRVIKKSPFWKPGMQNGRAVRVAYMMPVVFRME
ncbi:energy transducer TonB [Pedobacter arcticus]|uniref:energy transducer TonB n=1 Tax=Pedobacter arcticus TaxID=752140 RepID=UPI0002E9B2B4|nr:energy transducer TonB [Pedobacter arcticus]